MFTYEHVIFSTWNDFHWFGSSVKILVFAQSISRHTVRLFWCRAWVWMLLCACVCLYVVRSLCFRQCFYLYTFSSCFSLVSVAFAQNLCHSTHHVYSTDFSMLISVALNFNIWQFVRLTYFLLFSQFHFVSSLSVSLQSHIHATVLPNCFGISWQYGMPMEWARPACKIYIYFEFHFIIMIIIRRTIIIIVFVL